MAWMLALSREQSGIHCCITDLVAECKSRLLFFSDQLTICLSPLFLVVLSNGDNFLYDESHSGAEYYIL